MFSLHRRPGYLQFAQYFHFAEPFPPGVVVAYAGAIHPDDELASAAESLRATEVAAVRNDETVDFLPPVDSLESMKLMPADLELMSIDEVRAVASALDIPDRGKITEKAELVEEILRRL